MDAVEGRPDILLYQAGADSLKDVPLLATRTSPTTTSVKRDRTVFAFP